MSSWSDGRRILRGGGGVDVLPARMDAELTRSPYAGHGVDPRLTAPHLQQVLADAVAQATTQARADGYAAGEREGRAVLAAQAEVRRIAEQAAAEQQAAAHEQQRQQALAALRGAETAFRTAETTAVAHIEQTVVELALELARAVLGRELLAMADPAAEALGRALALAPDGGQLVARLHPADLATLADAGLARVELRPDPTVERGGCLVEGGGRRVDAQLGPALDRAAAELR